VVVFVGNAGIRFLLAKKTASGERTPFTMGGGELPITTRITLSSRTVSTI